MRPAFLLVGAPGTGKSSVVRGLVGERGAMMGRWSVRGPFCALGPYTGEALDGSDMLPRSARVFAREVERLLYPVGVLARYVGVLEGLSIGRTLVDQLAVGGRPFAALLLRAPASVLAARREARSGRAVGPSTLAYDVGRAERLAQFVRDVGGLVRVVDADRPIQLVTAEVRSLALQN